MKHASTPTSAVHAAVRGGRLARVVRAGVPACALAFLACTPALAERHGDHGADQYAQQDPRAQDPRAQQDPRIQQDARQHEQRMPAPPVREQRFEPRSFDSREVDSRQDPHAQEARHASRMTPDERRDLRRQINEAGMDLYPQQPRR